MKGYYRHILLASAALLAAASCTKTRVEEIPSEPMPISISAVDGAATKALLDKGTFSKTGNRLQIYDFVDDSATPYINDQIGPDVQGSPLAANTDGVWPFENGPHQWTPGKHKFFGWLAKDANMTASNTPDSFFGSGFSFNQGTQTLTIPSKQMTASTPQFDFMYSNVFTTEPINTPVNLMFSHLFTAVSIGVENSTSSFVKVEEFTIEGIPSTRGATVDFSGTAVAVDYSDWTEGATLTRGLDAGKAGYEISPKSLRSNIFNGSTTQEFMMLWPVESQHLYSTDKTTTTDEGEVVYPENWKMYIKYSSDGKTYEKRMNFPNISWEAGKRYHYDILFADKTIELTVHVKDWDYEHQDVDYTDASVGVESTGVLKWDSAVSEINEANKTVSIVNAQPAKGSFTIKAPVGGTWMISLTGDVNAFEVTPDNGEIDGITAHISVKPLISDPKRDYKVKLKFAVRRADGRVITADEVQPTVYTIVLPQNN